ncbi:hypothetical protein HY407_04820 [Candidatus Gottesmanbacteria bacterium]|nr:hypothetical protein [Candidatus Gottesmanbacteria bacterium]
MISLTRMFGRWMITYNVDVEDDRVQIVRLGQIRPDLAKVVGNPYDYQVAQDYLTEIHEALGIGQTGLPDSMST